MQQVRLAPRTDAPEPFPDLPDWFDDAACTALDLGWFFPEKGDRPDRAVAVCRTCPIVDDCLAYAVGERIRYGVWGGTTPEQRRPLLRQPRGARHAS